MSVSGVAVRKEATSESPEQVTLIALPVEVILQIFSFVDIKTLNRLQLVCKYFYDLLQDGILWEKRSRRLIPSSITYRILEPPGNNEHSWKRTCFAINKQSALWRTDNCVEEFPIVDNEQDTLYSNALMLMQQGRLLVAAKIHDELVVFDLVQPQNRPKLVKRWDGFRRYRDLTHMNDTIYAATDSGIYCMKLDNPGTRPYKRYLINKCMNVITSLPEAGIFAASGIDHGFVTVYDPLYFGIVKNIPVEGRVNTIVMDSKYIRWAEEGTSPTICVWDQQAGKMLKKIEIPVTSHMTAPSANCIRSIYLDKSTIYAGDRCGSIHVLEREMDFKVLANYNLNFKGPITKIHGDDGILIVCGPEDDTLVIHPLHPLAVADRLWNYYHHRENKKPFVTLTTAYSDGVFAYTSNDGVGIRRPKLRSS